MNYHCFFFVASDILNMMSDWFDKKEDEVKVIYGRD